MTPPGKTRLKMWIVAVGVFAFGGIAGASLDGAYRLRTNNNESQEVSGTRSSQETLERMKRDYGLNDQQATAILEIIEQTRTHYSALRAECGPRYDAIRQDARGRIRALLTTEQQRQFDIKVAEKDARRKAEKERQQ